MPKTYFVYSLPHAGRAEQPDGWLCAFISNILLEPSI
jgi:hypothetical protein